MKEIADASMQATESTVDVTPPQAATKIMVGMADGMAVWQTEWSNGGNGGNGRTAKRMAEWQNGRNGYIRTIHSAIQLPFNHSAIPPFRHSMYYLWYTPMSTPTTPTMTTTTNYTPTPTMTMTTTTTTMMTTT